MTSAWIHQLTRPAMRRLVEPPRQQKRHHQRGDEQADDDRFDRDRRAEPDRPHEGAPDEQVHDAGQHRDRKRRQHDAVRREPAAVRQIDDAEAVEKLDGRVAAECDESPEHERVRQAGDRTLDDRLSLADDVDEEAGDSESEVVERERVGSRRNQADARRDLRGEGADEDDDEQPEQQRGHL